MPDAPTSPDSAPALGSAPTEPADRALAPRRSPLHDVHAAAGAAFTGFAGWSMPVRYSSDLEEHRAVREAAGIFDLSHMAQLRVTGADAASALDAAIAADVSRIPLSRARYTMILAEDGGVIDDLIVYAVDEDDYLVIANAGNRDVVREALAERLAAGADASIATRDVAIEELDRALVAVQGPRALDVLERLDGLNPDPLMAHGHTLAKLPYYAAMGMRWNGHPVLAARTGYTGEDGFELAIAPDAAPALWDALVAVGAPLGLVPAGLASRDSLRLEAGMPLYGNELGRGSQPAQAGLGRIAPPKTKTADFVGREAVTAGPGEGARVLVGLVAEGRRAARAGYAVLAGDAVVGEVTSGILSPSLGHPIAMAYVDPAHADAGTALELDVRGTRIPAIVSTLPFYVRPTA